MANGTLSVLSPIEAPPQRLSDYVYDALCEAIVEGKLRPDQRLVEAEVAESLHVSRTPVREALAKLEQQHLLKKDLDGTNRVANWDSKTIWEFASLRAALEGLAITLAVKNLSEEDFEYLEGIIAQMERTAEVEQDAGKRMASLDIQFHSHIWACTGHKLLEEALENMKPQVRYYMYLTGNTYFARPTSGRNYPAEHRKLIEILRQGSQNMASEVMLGHILPAVEQALAQREREGGAEKRDISRPKSQS